MIFFFGWMDSFGVTWLSMAAYLGTMRIFEFTMDRPLLQLMCVQ